jgi:single-stranded DNA-specific DHH superfamily exonuclease
MLTKKQVKEIREHLDKARNPLFFFDNDVDGLCSFLLLSRKLGGGKGVAIKSFPSLDKNYVRKLYELKPDYIFILDKPMVSKGFAEEARSLNLPIVWIDHHEVEGEAEKEHKEVIDMDEVYYYNPLKNGTSEPVTYLSYKIAKGEEWLAMVGCIGDNFIPDFVDKFKKDYPELWKEVDTSSEALYESGIGKLTRVLDFALKDRTSNVVRMIRKLQKVKSPYEILKDSPNNKILRRFKQINKKYQKLIKKAEEVEMNKVLFFQYGGGLSLSANIANELTYKFPDKIIVVAYVKGEKANVSMRGENVKEITLKVIKDLDDATGGGHEHATGAKIRVEDLTEFKKKIEELA